MSYARVVRSDAMGFEVEWMVSGPAVRGLFEELERYVERAALLRLLEARAAALDGNPAWGLADAPAPKSAPPADL